MKRLLSFVLVLLVLLSAVVTVSAAEPYDSDKKLAAEKNIDLDKYVKLDWKYVENMYWYSTSKAEMTASSSSNQKKFICVDRKYSLEELPVGTIFFCDAGWQYRLEKYVAEDVKFTGTRPGNKTDAIYVLDKDFVGDYKYFTWNVSKTPTTDISAIYAEAAAHVRVYVPAPETTAAPAATTAAPAATPSTADMSVVFAAAALMLAAAVSLRLKKTH